MEFSARVGIFGIVSNGCFRHAGARLAPGGGQFSAHPSGSGDEGKPPRPPPACRPDGTQPAESVITPVTVLPAFEEKLVAKFGQLQFDWSAALRIEAVPERAVRPTSASATTGAVGARLDFAPWASAEDGRPTLDIVLFEAVRSFA